MVRGPELAPFPTPLPRATMSGIMDRPQSPADIVLRPLASEHEAALQQFASAPEIAATTRLPHPYPPGAARGFIAAMTAARAAGTAHVFAIERAGAFVGAIGLHPIPHERGRELGFWVGVPFQRQGIAEAAVRLVLRFGFRELGLPRVVASALETNGASRRLLQRCGFVLQNVVPHRDPLLKRPDERLAHYVLERTRWRELCEPPPVQQLHPALRAILDAELAAGNRVKEEGRGWPDEDSVFVRLAEPFRTRPVLPEGVVYSEPRDPHWWFADYTTTSPPRQTLAC